MSGGIEGGRQVFREEAREILEELESALLGLEESPDDKDLVGRVFRAMHTLKGSGAMFGFDDISSFTHEIENYFDHVRSGRLRVTKELVDLTLGSLDQIRTMLDAYSGGAPADKDKTARLAESYRKLLSDGGIAADAKAGRTQSEPPARNRPPRAGKASTATYAIRFKPSQEIMLTGSNPAHLLNELRTLGDCQVTAHTEKIPSLEEIEPEKCYIYWDIVLTSLHCQEEVKDVFIFVEDESELDIKRVDGVCAGEEQEDVEEGPHRLIGDILIEQGSASPVARDQALKEARPLGEVLVDMGVVTPEDVEAALAEQKALDRRRAEKASASIRVASERLDVLADLVGQMVTAQARLSRTATDFANPELTSITEEMEKLTEMLRDNTLSMRMVPIGTTFTKFKRLVRDLARGLDKEVFFATSGGDTELDKTVIERLGDPLMHLIRNSIDHGIETPDERRSAGKPGSGSVKLSASHSGGSVYITIEDDGRGLDPESIREAALAKGLLSADDKPDEKSLYQLILHPGFTTARSVSSISGRGVGMDVVKKCMDSLRGSIEISSRKGEATTITLKLPLTLAIIDGLLVSVADTHYVIPLASVRECVERVRAASSVTAERQFMDVRGELIPCIPLRRTFDIKGTPPAIEHMVIVEEGGWKVGIAVDEVVGEHQTVIKPLSRAFRGVEGLSGATILGDGRLALIVDVPGLVRCAQTEENALLKTA